MRDPGSKLRSPEKQKLFDMGQNMEKKENDQPSYQTLDATALQTVRGEGCYT